ncbi:MAG TPA: M60 family metallopeptidase [Phycisphaerae bacterium]|nr:M60 family metallopeptidase [Phycisphaerae bacterium]
MFVLAASVATFSSVASDESDSAGNGRDRDRLVTGVHEIAAPGTPGPLSVFGEKAFVVATGGVDGGEIVAPVVAAARFGKGRVVAFGHTGYLDPEALGVGETGRLMANAIEWAAGEDRSIRDDDEGGVQKTLRVGLMGRGGMVDALRAAGFDGQGRSKKEFFNSISAFDVICLGQEPLSEEEIRSVQSFVRDGGGLIMAGLGWGWLQLNPGKSLDAHPGNRLLADVGIAWTSETLSRTTDHGFAISREIPESCHAIRAIDLLERCSKDADSVSIEERRQASATALLAIRTLPATDTTLLPRLRRLSKAQSGDRIPTASRPLSADQDALARVLLALDLVELDRADVTNVKAHPAAAEFPGAVPEGAEVVVRTVELDLSIPGRRSLGLYAPPGGLIRVRLEGVAPRKGLALRIGAHSDSLFHHVQWKRAPQISRRFEIEGDDTPCANAFGGLIYVEVPDGRSGIVRVEVAGAVEAPLFVLGKTSNDDWKSRIRNRLAPWAELATSKIIVTVPSASVRSLDDPTALMKFWDQIADAHAELAAMPKRRNRPERFVADVQISAGYMHAGYPIMTHLDAAEFMTQLDTLKRGSWGLLHELGHNHQAPEWTFDGTGEVTCNLFALHAIDTICTPPAGTRGHEAVDRPPGFAAFAKRGAKFEEWKRDPFLALQMYVQLQREFGWESFKRVFAEYRALPAEVRPKNDAEKRDQWMTRYSRTVGRNLGPFFEAWGVPTSEAARASIADLPAWAPADLTKVDTPTAP